MIKMKTLVCQMPGELEYVEKERPIIKTGESLILIKRIGICGTDLHAFEGKQPFFSYPRILGHELSGILIEPNGAEGFVDGEVVTFIPYFNCGHCIACRNAKPNCCENITVCGVHADGGMVEYLAVPTHSLIHGEGLSFDELALVEPLAIGAHGVRRADIKPGEYVLVTGAGPIGLGIMEFSRIAGATVIAMDVNKARLDFCKEKLKVEYTVNAITDDVAVKIAEITGGDMPTVVFDATGNLQAINAGFGLMAHGARYVLVGLQKEEISISHPEFHKREATLISGRNATRADFEHVIASMKKGLVNPTNYITHRVSFCEVGEQFESWLNPANEVIKAMVSVD
jgi:2-desacetyl-2-hydroxyethyl bacteriochlorophyllide A dehydrogenase